MDLSAGRHLILDGYVADPTVFEKEYLEALFFDLTDSLDMHIIQGPSFVEVPLDESKLGAKDFQDEGGITGSAIISTSHLAIHCWPLRGYFSLDCFSCKDFDAQKALQLLTERLGIRRVNIVNLERMKPQVS